MTMRYWCAIGWGAVAEVTAICLTWLFTDWGIGGVVLSGLVAFCVIAGAIIMATEKKPARVQRQNTAPREFKIVNLRKEDW